MTRSQIRKRFLQLLKRNDLTKDQIQRCSKFLKIYGHLHKSEQEAFIEQSRSKNQ